MKNNWKEEFRKEFIGEGYTHPGMESFIESLLEKQKKELITQIPDELKTFVRMSIDSNWQFTEEQVIKAEVAWNKLMERKLAEQKKELMKSIDKMLDDAIFHCNATGSSGESVMAYQSIKTLLESLNHHD